MKLIFRVFNDNAVIDNYEYSDNEFIYNDKLIEVKNKVNKLIHLFSLTSDWKDNRLDSVKDGFYVRVESNQDNKEYFFYNSVPDNFMVFVDEVKRMALEGK